MSQELRIPYEESGHKGFAYLGQSIVSGRLRWSRSISCPGWKQIEEDGEDFPPDWLRELLLKDGGWWDVVAEGPSRGTLIKALKDIFCLSLEDAMAKANLIPIVYTGTKTEAEWVKLQLAAENIDSDIVEASQR